MRFYSDKLNRIFDSEDALKEAENKLSIKEQEEQKKKEERKTRAAEVEEAFKKVETAQEEANALLSKFIKDYGSFHTTMKSERPINSLFDFIFNW